MKCQLLGKDLNVKKVFKKLNVTKHGVSIMEGKSQVLYVYIKNLRTPGANILKQDALSIGADVAVPKGTICCENHSVDALVMGTPTQLKELAKKAKLQDFGLKKVADFLNSISVKKYEMPQIMGIVNINEDSFYKEGRSSKESAFFKVLQMIEDGANIVDIGAVSSRPGSKKVLEEEELLRLQEVIDKIYKEKLYEKCSFSLDSYSPLALEYALDRGFKIINDITGLSDDRVAKLAARYGAKVCVMHMQGEPSNMQIDPKYEDVIDEVDRFFIDRIDKANSFGVKDLILDVGIGFGKNLEHNLLLIKHHMHFTRHKLPLLIGASRKSMINAIIKSEPNERLAGSLAIHLKAVENGASIVRCHDVKEHIQAFKVECALKESLV